MLRRTLFPALLATLAPGALLAQSAATPRPALTVEQIMQAPARWVGTSPTGIFWSADSKQVFFRWNPTQQRRDSLYRVAATGGTAQLVPNRQAVRLPAAEGVYDAARRHQVYTRGGDLFLFDVKAGAERRLTLTNEVESAATFVGGGPTVAFRRGDNLFQFDPRTGLLTQLIDLRRGIAPDNGRGADQRDALRREQLRLFDVLRQRDADRKATQALDKRLVAGQPHPPKPVYVGEQDVEELRVSPDGRYVTYRLATAPGGAERLAQVPAFVTASGYTEDLPTRSKVGDRQARYALGIYDRVRDTAYAFTTKKLPGLYDRPAYLSEYPAPRDTARREREVLPFGPFWSTDGKRALLGLRALDNKDRWLLLLDPTSGRIEQVLDRQHDDAWIGGPGIEDFDDDQINLGWLPGPQPRVWFHSEESGWSHLYVADAVTGQKRALTSGAFEVQYAHPTRDGKWFYLVTNETDLGEKQLWRIAQDGGERERLSTGRGAYEVVLSPDEQHVAARWSTENQPWELVTFDPKPRAPQRVLTHSTTKAFEAYPWRTPEVVSIPARDGQAVRARLYRPATGAANGAAVVFVHGAGYLQNAHHWWSHYFREYQFHNLLADRGYTVLDVDYRGSAGYGRDFRTGIYRYMGGKDLSDEIDAAAWLVVQAGVDPKRIGMYGGSYGGFMTLMALFTQPDVFACGAALRSVTDWAHYNHGYTANILNTPQLDSVAYHRSSPIFFADGLRRPLLMCHGMVDTNVHFQDIVRLSQRLIELGKKDWELAVYPVEDHAFVEPTSWADEYSRILKLFETHLQKP